MAQHDYVIANGTGSAVRSDLNDALAAIVSMNSGSTEPSTTFAFQFWADTNANLLKMRNSANDGWIELRQLDGEFTSVSVANGTAAAPSIFFNASGTDTGIYSNGTDSVDVSTGGTRRLDIGSAGDVTVRGGNVTLNAQGDLRLADSDSSNWVAFQAPATVASNVTWTLPAADGTSGQTLQTNGSGTLSWSTPSATVDKIEEGNTSAEVVDTGSDGHFKVVTEGTEALRVTAAQRVGIGLAAPATALHLSNSSTLRINNPDGTRNLDLFNDGNNAEIKASVDPLRLNAEHSTGYIRFDTNNTERVRLTSAGNLGIGTTTVQAPLHIGTASAWMDIGASAGNRAKLGYDSNNLYFGSSSGTGQFIFKNNIGSTDHPVTSGTELARIDGSGNLKFNSGYGSAATAYGVRAWVNLNGTGTVAIRSSGNCSSITDVSTGQYQFNFATAMPDANYAAVAEVRVDTSGENTRIGNTTYSTTQFEIEVTTAGNVSYSDSDLVNIIVVR